MTAMIEDNINAGAREKGGGIDVFVHIGDCRKYLLLLVPQVKISPYIRVYYTDRRIYICNI